MFILREYHIYNDEGLDEYRKTYREALQFKNAKIDKMILGFKSKWHYENNIYEVLEVRRRK